MTDELDRAVLGAMFFGTTIDEPTSFDLLDRYVDAGGVWIDTADCYAFWASDTAFGGQSEEHLVVEAPGGGALAPGTPLLARPTPVCPRSAHPERAATSPWIRATGPASRRGWPPT